MWIAVPIAIALLVASATGLVVFQRRRTPDAEGVPVVSDAGGDVFDRATFLAAALDDIATAVVIVDDKGGTVLRNRAANPYHDARHGAALVEVSIQARLQEGQLGHANTEALRLHGPPERVMLVTGRPVVVDGEVVGALALVEDATEPQRLAAMRRDFVANVSHELRTPVGAISLLAETLESESDPEVIGRFAARIRHEMSRLAKLIDDLLDLSRIEGGELKREELSVMSVVREAAAAIGPLAANADVALEVAESAADVTVLGDRAQLASAIRNLLDNAVKYTEAGGRVTARLRVQGDEVAIEIEDTGSGIPARDLHRVFERFYRVDRGRSSESGGTGLGLSIVRHVALNHGGHVDVESREGSGSTFTVVLPASGAESQVA